MDKPMDKPMDEPMDKPMDEPMDKSMDKTMDKAMKWGLNKTVRNEDMKYKRSFSSANLAATWQQIRFYILVLVVSNYIL